MWRVIELDRRIGINRSGERASDISTDDRPAVSPLVASRSSGTGAPDGDVVPAARRMAVSIVRQPEHRDLVIDFLAPAQRVVDAFRAAAPGLQDVFRIAPTVVVADGIPGADRPILETALRAEVGLQGALPRRVLRPKLEHVIAASCGHRMTFPGQVGVVGNGLRVVVVAFLQELAARNGIAVCRSGSPAARRSSQTGGRAYDEETRLQENTPSSSLLQRNS